MATTTTWDRQDKFPKIAQRWDQGPTTDIKEWLSDNAPQDYAELQELRKALYARRTYGRFFVRDCGVSRFGEEKFVVKGRDSSLLIVSDKARHFLLRSLCRLLRGN